MHRSKKVLRGFTGINTDSLCVDPIASLKNKKTLLTKAAIQSKLISSPNEGINHAWMAIG